MGQIIAMTASWVSDLALPAAIAAAGAAAPVLVLHVALAHAMRARGHLRWRVRDTALVSPLLAGGLFVAFGALAHGAVRAASDAAAGRAGGAHLLACVLAAAAAFVVAGFGARAVGKLY
jgi:cytochrome bd-type quinol oxidase subunit 2